MTSVWPWSTEPSIDPTTAVRFPARDALAAFGAAAARCRALAAAVEAAGRAVDAEPGVSHMLAACELRQAVEEGCLAVVNDVARAGGADHVTHDEAQARRLADLPVYVRQHHGARDAASFGSALLADLSGGAGA